MTVEELYEQIGGDYQQAIRRLMNDAFVAQFIVKLLDDHKAGHADNSRKIWTVFMFLVWYNVYFEMNDPAEVLA